MDSSGSGNGKSLLEYPVNAGVPEGTILGPAVLYISDLLLDKVIFNIDIYADDTTLYSKCNQASDLWQQLEFLNLNKTFETQWIAAGSCLLILMLEKFKLFHLTYLRTLVLLM